MIGWSGQAQIHLKQTWNTPRHSGTWQILSSGFIILLAQRKPQKLDSEDNVPTDIANCRSYAKFCGWTQSKPCGSLKLYNLCLSVSTGVLTANLNLMIGKVTSHMDKFWSHHSPIGDFGSPSALVDGYGSNKLEVPNSDHQMGSLETTKITGDITMIAQPAPIYPHLNFWWTQSWLFQATKKSSADIPIFRMWHITRQSWQRNHGPSDPQALSPRAVPLAMYIVPFRFPLFSLR